MEVSRVLSFDGDSRSHLINIDIFDDSEREITPETVNLQLSFVERESSSSLLLLPRQATVTILDDDCEYNSCYQLYTMQLSEVQTHKGEVPIL